MRAGNVSCPACQTLLQLPPGCLNAKVRCGKCNHRFRVTTQVPVTEDAVASWLLDAEKNEHLPHHSEEVHPSEPISGNTAILQPAGGRMHIVKLDRQGVTFEFPADLLKEESFRSSLPRCCMKCGSQVRLMPRLIRFTSQLLDSWKLENDRRVPAVQILTNQIVGLEGKALLRRLPLVPGLPSPANLPMPYWLCEMCDGSGVIAGQVQMFAGGDGWAHLWMHNLRRAEEFFIAAGGEGCQDHWQLRRFLTSCSRSPWENLPTTVQGRLQQWFRPKSGETFVAYVPDRDHDPNEDGSAGLIISNLRLIYHTQVKHKESLLSDPLEMQVCQQSGRGLMRIKSPSWEIKCLVVDGAGIEATRKSLAEAKFHVAWR